MYSGHPCLSRAFMICSGVLESKAACMPRNSPVQCSSFNTCFSILCTVITVHRVIYYFYYYIYYFIYYICFCSGGVSFICVCVVSFFSYSPQSSSPSARPKLSSSKIITLEPGPKSSEKSADLSLKVGKSGSNSKPLENLFPANPASESPFQEQQINVYQANIERSSHSSIVTPKYNALCGMAKCYVMNPLNGMMRTRSDSCLTLVPIYL